MGVKLQSALGGSVELTAPSTATNYTLAVPAGNGTVATTDQLQSFRNIIINGNMDINQRGTGVVTNDALNIASASNFTVDRWKTYHYNATGNFDTIVTTQQYSDHPTFGANGKCLRLTVTTADTPTTGTDFLVFRYDIEGSHSYHLYGKPLTLSFWVKTNSTGTYGVQLRAVGATDGLNNPNYFTTYSVASSGVWQKIVLNIPPQNLSLTSNGNGSGYTLYMTLCSAQNEVSNPGIAACFNAWARYQSDGIGSTALSNTLTATVNNYFQMTDVQMEVGSIATDFERRPPSVELSLCQRYYYKQYASQAGAYGWFNTGFFVNATTFAIWSQFPVTMRATPSCSFSAPSTFMTDGGGSGVVSAITSYYPTTYGVRVYATGSGGTSGYSCALGSQNPATAWIEYNSEL